MDALLPGWKGVPGIAVTEDAFYTTATGPKARNPPALDNHGITSFRSPRSALMAEAEARASTFSRFRGRSSPRASRSSRPHCDKGIDKQGELKSN
jgi:hypothetical protein